MEQLIAALKAEMISNGITPPNDLVLTRIAKTALKTANCTIVPRAPGGSRVFAVPLPHLGGDPKFWHYLNTSQEWRPMAPISFEMQAQKPIKIA